MQLTKDQESKVRKAARDAYLGNQFGNGTHQWQDAEVAACNCVQEFGIPNDEAYEIGREIAGSEVTKIDDREESEREIEKYDSGDYDTEAMKIDLSNNNFEIMRAEEYRHENIVRESLINGQFTQAKSQCSQYGLNYELELHKFRTNT